MTLVAVPNVSTATPPPTLVAAFTRHARLLDVHSDADHGRSVLTLAGEPGKLAHALAEGAVAAAAAIDLTAHAGAHPHVGALDVAPVVFLTPEQRPAALAEALTAAARIGDAGLPVFLYGLLADGRTRAELRRGGVQGLVERGTPPDFGPRSVDPRAGAVLVAARPPLIAFNLELAPPATLADARRIAAQVRGPALKAIGLQIRGDVAQVSMNVEDHRALPLAEVVAQVREHAPVAAAEVVGLPPEAAFAGYPEDLPTRGRRTLESQLAP